jgi:predicted RNase H-like nuclease (RuvC/YqgF family)
MEIVNGKMVVTKPPEFDITKVQISELAQRYQDLQQTLQLLTQKNLTHSQELDRTKTQIDLLDNRYQQIETGVKSLTQKQAAIDKNSKSWIGLQTETKALRTQNALLSRKLAKQRNQQIILALAAIPILLTSIVWTEVRLTSINPGSPLTTQKAP